MQIDRDTIIKLAREAGFEFKDRAEPRLERFAALVAARTKTSIRPPSCRDAIERARREEREACALICDEQAEDYGGVAEGPFVTDFGAHTLQSMSAGAMNCATAIRARSDQ